MEPTPSKPLPLRALNHISRVVQDLPKSVAFYRDVLGFCEIKRPSSFDFEGSWLFNYNIGIHLIGGQPVKKSEVIIPKSEHLSFQADNLAEVEARLSAKSIEFVKQTVEEAGVRVSQLFFHDPDNNMIEVCNCDILPIIFLEAEEPHSISCPFQHAVVAPCCVLQQVDSLDTGISIQRRSLRRACSSQELCQLPEQLVQVSPAFV